MNWNEETTRQYLDERGVDYRTYRTPEESLRAYGQVGDSGVYFDGWRSKPVTLVARLGRDVVLQSSKIMELVTPEGSPIEAQIGGTLDEFIERLRAWQAMATGLYPQNPFTGE